MISIILIKPQMGENIGATARVMANFGISDLRIVSPRDGWPNAKAIEMSAHAEHLIENAGIFDSTEAAIADLDTIYATTVRPREMVKDVVDAKTFASEVSKKPKAKIGVMFGAEKSGLENKDIVKAKKIITIPVDEVFQAKYNLKKPTKIITSKQKKSPPASAGEIEFMIGFLDKELSKNNFFKEPNKKPKMMDNINNIFTRNNLTSQEVKTLMGIFKCLRG
jgi:tRNA/rRNA methyltransferase